MTTSSTDSIKSSEADTGDNGISLCTDKAGGITPTCLFHACAVRCGKYNLLHSAIWPDIRYGSRTACHLNNGLS